MYVPGGNELNWLAYGAAPSSGPTVIVGGYPLGAVLKHAWQAHLMTLTSGTKGILLIRES